RLSPSATSCSVSPASTSSAVPFASRASCGASSGWPLRRPPGTPHEPRLLAAPTPGLCVPCPSSVLFPIAALRMPRLPHAHAVTPPPCRPRGAIENLAGRLPHLSFVLLVTPPPR